MEIISGQALVEGIAMRSTEWRVAVVRRASGELLVGTGPMPPSRFRTTPFLRGLVLWLVDSPVEMEWAAAKIEEDDRDLTEEEKAELLRADRGSPSPPEAEQLPPQGTRRPVAVLAGLMLSQIIPQAATHGGLRALSVELEPSAAAFQACMTAAAFAIFALYMLAVRRVGGVSRVMQYFAAFTMALWARNEKHTPARLRRHPGWHFESTSIGMALTAIVVGVLAVGSFALVPAARGGSLTSHAVTCGLRVLLLPIAIGLASELQRGLTALGHGPAVRALFAPLIAFDRFATVAPEDEHVEVAARALRELKKLHA